MRQQGFFNFTFNNSKYNTDFYVNDTNSDAFNHINNKTNSSQIILVGPNKSGKTLLGNIWKYNNNAQIFKNNFEYLISKKVNIFVDNYLEDLNENQLFHIINHCNNYNLKILITSNQDLIDSKIKLLDLISRLKIFKPIKILQPDDDMLRNLLTKYFVENQIIIKSNEIFEYIIRRTDRTYEGILKIANQIDNLSLEKKRELTIPLIREIL